MDPDFEGDEYEAFTYCEECDMDIDIPKADFCPFCGEALGRLPLTAIFPSE